MIEWRNSPQIQRRQHLHAMARAEQLLVLDLAARSLGGIAGEQDRNRVKIRAGEAAHPVVGMIGAGIAENRCAGGHSLFERVWKRRQRCVIHSKRPQTVPGERHGHPPRVLRDRSACGTRRVNSLEQGREPSSSAGALPKRQEVVSSGERGNTRQESRRQAPVDAGNGTVCLATHLV
jgi:hypothetical protein